jgi:phosphatidate cytidylyltransferase
VSASRWADLGVRVASAAVLIPLVLADVWFGGVWFEIFVGLLFVLVAREWVAIVHGGNDVQFALHAAAALAGALLPLQIGIAGAVYVVAALALIAAIHAVLVGGAGPWKFFGVAYAGFPPIAFEVLRQGGSMGLKAIIWVMVVVWCADTLAYAAGRTFGGPKLAPRISPNKTWSGLLGAVVGAAIAALVFQSVTGAGPFLATAAVAAALAIVEQGGDLFKSAMKRAHGVKDSGGLIPGHGGVIDRIDGLIAVALAAAILGVWRAGQADAAAGLLIW